MCAALPPDLGPAEYKVKRRWDDDVVFRNQSRTEPLAKKRFINDVLRSGRCLAGSCQQLLAGPNPANPGGKRNKLSLAIGASENDHKRPVFNWAS